MWGAKDDTPVQLGSRVDVDARTVDMHEGEARAIIPLGIVYSIDSALSKFSECVNI